jgi:hypothetical protein
MRKSFPHTFTLLLPEPLSFRCGNRYSNGMTQAAQKLIAAAKKLADENGHGRDWDAVATEAGLTPEIANQLVMLNLVNGVEAPGELHGVFEISFNNAWFFNSPARWGFKV